jgi:proline racemase
VLLLGVGAASAQTTKSDEAPAGVSPSQQNAPAKKIAPAEKIAPDQKSSQRKASETTGQAAPMAPASDNQKQMKSQTTDKDAPAGAAAKSSSEERNRSTTGQGAAAGSAKLSAEQSTKISAVIRQHKVAPARLNVEVRVGTRVPGNVHFYPLPRQVYVIYPEWRGYNYIMVGDEIIVLDPRTHEIVAILQA